jgi:hypothetical protein
MAGHSITHSDMPQQSVPVLEKELADPIGLIKQQTGANVRSFATPSGLYTQRELPFFEKYYDSHRTAFLNLNDVAADRYQLFGVNGDADITKVIADLEEAAESDRWAVLIYHQVNETGQGFFAASRANLAKTIDFVRVRGIPVSRVDEGVERLRRPVAIESRPNSNGRPKAILTAEQARLTPIGAEAPTPGPSPAPTQAPAAPAALPVPTVPVTTLAVAQTTIAPAPKKPAPVAAPAAKARAGKGFVVFADALAPGIDDWSWATRDLGSQSPVRGTASIRAELSEWKGIYFHGSADLTGTTTLEMYVHGGNKGGQNLKVVARTGANAYKSLPLPPLKANVWSKVRIPMSRLGLRAGKVVFDLQLTDGSGAVQEPISLDDIRFTR